MAQKKPDSIDLTSPNFDANEALSSECDLEAGKVYDDLIELQNENTAQISECKVEPSVWQNLPGVYWEGGIPKRVARKVDEGRHFTADQAPIESVRQPKGSNVLKRMEEVSQQDGPLFCLKQALDKNQLIKVHIRNDRGVRSVLRAYLMAFDKHLNMVLRDVTEVFIAKKKYKTYATGDARRSLIVDMGSMTIEEDLSRTSSTRTGFIPGQPSLLTQFKQYQQEHQRGSTPPAPTAAGEPPTPRQHILSDDKKRALQEQVRGDRFKTALSEPAVMAEKQEDAGDHRRLKLAMSTNEEEESGGSEARRRRQRKTMEVRRRNVRQLLVRGEHVVLVSREQ